MPRNDHRGRTGNTGALRDHVAFRVDTDVAQPERLQPAAKIRRACSLLEGGRGDFADGDLLFNGLRLGTHDVRERLADAGVFVGNGLSSGYSGQPEEQGES